MERPTPPHQPALARLQSHPNNALLSNKTFPCLVPPHPPNPIQPTHPQQAVVHIISDAVNSTVPIAAEALKAAGVHDRRRLLGVTTLDVVRPGG